MKVSRNSTLMAKMFRKKMKQKRMVVMGIRATPRRTGLVLPPLPLMVA